MTVDHAGAALDRGRRMRKLLIADDDVFQQAVLVAQLSARFDIVGAARDAGEAIELAELHRPDAALIDVWMPGGGGLRATREISECSPEITIVALSSEESEPVVLSMLEAGATTYVRKGVSATRLTRVLDSAIAAHATLLADYGGREYATLLIADDEAFTQSILCVQLRAEYDIVGGAMDASRAIELAELHQPDVAIIDVQMPAGGGVRAAREIRERAPRTAIVAFSSDARDTTVEAMMRAGATTYLQKGTIGHELTEHLRAAKLAHAKLFSE
jgi:DNA-binding NarL/FixJ family response regulator